MTLLEFIKDKVVISGGFAWHIISPPHIENRLLHDHKDIDIYVFPNKFMELITFLKEKGYKKTRTKYDGIDKDFYRYIKYEPKIILDVFVKEIPFIEVKGFNIVEPKFHLSLYEKTQTSKDCIAVKNAIKLIEKGISLIDHESLIDE